MHRMLACGLACMALCTPSLPLVADSHIRMRAESFQRPCPSVGYPSNGGICACPVRAGVGPVSHEQWTQAGVRAGNDGKFRGLTHPVPQLHSDCVKKDQSSRAFYYVGRGRRHAWQSIPCYSDMSSAVRARH